MKPGQKIKKKEVRMLIEVLLEILAVLIKLFWILVFAGLVIAESLFCIQLQKLLKLHKKYKKEYALASNNGHNGHRGREMKDIENDLAALRLEVISWACIAIACAYCILDCFTTRIIK